MRKKTQLKLLLLKEFIDFDIMDYLYINSGLRYIKILVSRIVNLYKK